MTLGKKIPGTFKTTRTAKYLKAEVMMKYDKDVIIELAHVLVNREIKKINETDISNNNLENVLLFMREKKIKGENRNEEMKKIIIKKILQLYNDIKEKSKTAKKREIIFAMSKIVGISQMLKFTITKKCNIDFHQRRKI